MVVAVMPSAINLKSRLFFITLRVNNFKTTLSIYTTDTMSYFKSIERQKKELEARERMTEEERREATVLDIAKTARVAVGRQAAEMQAEMNITDVLSEAALAGKVEFGIKPKISVLLDVFDKYTAMWTPITKDKSIVLPPVFALSLLMKSILKNLDNINQKNYPIIGALPWEEDFNYMSDKAQNFLKAFNGIPAHLDIISKLGEPEISDTLRDYLLHCSFTKRKISVGSIVDWALTKVVLERDLQ